jgi:AcrR family transcriptional regulator
VNEESLRKKHVDRTRAAITEAAQELFRERGFAATTVEDIARRADVAPRTFFRYFATKESVVFDGAQDKVGEIRDRLARRPADEPVGQSLLAVMASVGDELADDPEKVRLMCRLAQENSSLLTAQRRAMIDQLTSTLVGLLSERSGVPANDVGLQSMVAAVVACTATALQSWLDEGAEGRPRDYIEQALSACRTAFANPA